jgi:hypothetical protein
MIEWVCVEFIPDKVLKVLGELSTKLGSRRNYILICYRYFNDLLRLLFLFFLLNFQRYFNPRFLWINLCNPLWNYWNFFCYLRNFNFSNPSINLLIIHSYNFIWSNHLSRYRCYRDNFFFYLFLRLSNLGFLLSRGCRLLRVLLFLFLHLLFGYRHLLVSIFADSQLQSSPLLIVHLGSGSAAVEGQVEELLGPHSLHDPVDVRAYLPPHLVELVRLTHLQQMLI